MRLTMDTLKKLDTARISESVISPSFWREKIFSRLKTVHKTMAIKVVTLIVYLVAAIGIYTGIIHKNKSTIESSSLLEKHNKLILRELDDINVQLQDLSHHPTNSKKQQSSLESIEKNVSEARQIMTEVAKVADIERISTQVASVKEDVDMQMSDLKKAVAEGMGNKQYLDPSALPFQVISVDIIGNQPYATVNDEGHFTPLGVSDMLAGWRLVLADYDIGTAEFINAKNQYVKVSLQGS